MQVNNSENTQVGLVQGGAFRLDYLTRLIAWFQVGGCKTGGEGFFDWGGSLTPHSEGSIFFMLFKSGGKRLICIVIVFERPHILCEVSSRKRAGFHWTHSGRHSSSHYLHPH